MRYLYSLLFYLALPWLFLRLLWRSRRNPEYRNRWAERLGFCPHQLKKCIWIHAVSVGETIAAQPLIKALLLQYPNIQILVTNMTPTGAARVKAAFGDQVLQAYIPYDLPDAVTRFLKNINPLCAIIMETELWPNLFAACKEFNVPIMIANARLSEKSARGYHYIKAETAHMLSAVQLLAAQSQADEQRFIALGLDKEKITVTGNLKFDLDLPANLATQRDLLLKQLSAPRPIWIAASTHPGEEEIILAAHHQVREKMRDALLILVPRHPERFNAVTALTEQDGFNTVRRSSGQHCTAETAVYLGDTMGELLLLYSVADVAFVGGSFVSVGGHNMLEPAVLGKPVLTGTYLFNFSEISDMLLHASGMIKVNEANELAAEVVHFFQDSAYRNKIGENARGVVEANRGALARQLSLVKRLIG